ncbi:MAG: cupin domain-containing protein [Meiothermus sp.]|nr:cupin domain-containing protein [Meiothermus sp.]
MNHLSFSFDPIQGTISGKPRLERRLSDLEGVFVDQHAYQQTLSKGNPVIYSVSSVEDFVGQGDLQFGLGCLMPGKIGDEYFLTKGHLHTWREAAEVYVGLSGTGLMLLETKEKAWAVELKANSVVYVPGGTAHRTVNTGSAPLLYLGFYPAGAGHDYESIRAKNFRQVVLEQAGKPAVLERGELLGQRS